MNRPTAMLCLLSGALYAFDQVGLALASEPLHTTDLPAPITAPAAQPHLARTPDGGTIMSWLAHRDVGVALQFAPLLATRWGTPGTVASGSDWFVNWADFPSVQPISDTLWAAHWLRKKPGGTYAYDVMTVLSSDGGETWTDARPAHLDDTPTEHGFVSLFPQAGGVGAVWLDGRNMDPASGHEHHGAGAMTLRTATLHPGQPIPEATVIDARVCDCCQTDAAITAHGPVIVYRDRSDTEIRDIHIARHTADGWITQAVHDDGWEIAACPVNGPAIDAAGQNVAVAWFTAARNIPAVRVAFSNDAGATFSIPWTVNDPQPAGAVDVVLDGSAGAWISWLSHASSGMRLCIARVSATAQSPARCLAYDGQGRSGFPQLHRADDAALLLAWADARGKPPRLHTALVPIDQF